MRRREDWIWRHPPNNAADDMADVLSRQRDIVQTVIPIPEAEVMTLHLSPAKEKVYWPAKGGAQE